jgi:enterochelin esterase-like enzyme
MGIRVITMRATFILISIVISVSISLYGQGHKPIEKKYDVFLKTSDSWKMINKELTVSNYIFSEDPKILPGKYFHGALLKKELEGRKPGPVTFHVDFPTKGDFIFYLETVSDTGIVTIHLDKKILKTFTFLTGPEGKGPWSASRFLGGVIYQCDYNKEYSVNIPAGKHDIIIQNMGTDWLSIGYFVLTGYSKKILSQEYEDWKIYKTTIGDIGKRLENYKENALRLSLLNPGNMNYDLLPTLQLQIENLEQLAAHHGPADFNLLRTENELNEIVEYVKAGKDYFKLKTGRVKVGYVSTIDSTIQPYDVLIPKNYDPSKRYAMILSLHGYQNEIQKYSNLVGENKIAIPDPFRVITVSLYGRRNHFYQGAAEEDVLTVMNIVQSKYSIDPDRVYLTGSSMGGYGTWFIGLNYSHLFAAVSPVCPPSIFQGTKFVRSISPIEYISNAQHLPARIYHGAIDSTVNVNDSRQMVSKLKEMNYDYVYTEYPDVGHDSWNNADADTNRLPWLLKYTRNMYPLNVRHKAFYLRYGKAYWLQITSKNNWNEFAEINGEITGKNEINIHTHNISSFFIDLKHPNMDPQEPLKIFINDSLHVLDKYSEGIDFQILKGSTWVMGKRNESGLTKKQGLEGPFNAVETNKFLLVYGTDKADKAGFLKKIGILLQKNYSGSDMEIQLVPDTLVMQDNLAKTNNLYLLGSPDENKYLKEIVSGLPLSFSKDSLTLNGTYSRLETGIQMIYPNPKQIDKYIIVDKYPEFLPDTDRLINFPVADYFIYSLKGGKFEILKDEYFGSDWQVIK